MLAASALALAPSAVPLAQPAALLLLDGRPLGELGDAQFAHLFFGIWLAPQTSEPALRAALLAGTEP